jgi:hypothetical protein
MEWKIAMAETDYKYNVNNIRIKIIISNELNLVHVALD